MICPFCHAENIEGADECVECGHALYGLDLPDESHGKQSPDFIHQPLSNLRRLKPALIEANDPVGLAIHRMQSDNTDCVLVMEGEKLAGIITGWDVLQKVAGAGDDLNAVSCGQVMTPSPRTLRSEDNVALALNLMAAGGFRHVPLTEDGKPVSVIDVSDVFHYISPYLV
jgi:CBS domain-containing protein